MLVFDHFMAKHLIEALPYDSRDFFNPWMSLWEDMIGKAHALKHEMKANKKDRRYKQCCNDIANLAAWMEKEETKHKIIKAGSKWWKMVCYSTADAVLVRKLLIYYHDMWERLKRGGNSIDAAYRCLDYMHEFPQMISWDIDEVEKRCSKREWKYGGEWFSVRKEIAMEAVLEHKVYELNNDCVASLDDESGLVVA